MFLFKGLHSLAAKRGDGLRPELLDHLDHREAFEAANVEEFSSHLDGRYRQAGPNPAGRIVAEAAGGVLPFGRNGTQAAYRTEPEGPAFDLTTERNTMFIAMNRFKVKKGSEEAFENIWKGRDSKLHEMKGFKQFHLLRGPENEAEGYTLFASHTVWARKDDFTAWTKSENFRAAHRNAGSNDVHYLGHPQFEGFSVVEGA